MGILEWVCTRKNKLESCSNLTWLLMLWFSHIILIFSLFCSGLLAWLKWSDIRMESTHMCSVSFLWQCWILFCWYMHLKCLQAQIKFLYFVNKIPDMPRSSLRDHTFLSVPLLYFGLHTQSQYADNSTIGFMQILSWGHHSLETTYCEPHDSWDYVFVGSIYIA